MSVSYTVSITENSTSTTNNTSSVTVKLIATWNSGTYDWYDTNAVTFTIRNASSSGTVLATKTISGVWLNPNSLTSGTQTLATWTTTITHNTNGAKTIHVTGAYKCSYSSSNGSATATKTLTTIARKATISSAPNFTDESSPTITYSNPAGSSVTSLKVGIFGTDGSTVYASYRTVGTTSTSYTFTLTSAEKTRLQAAFPSSKTGTVRFYIQTVLSGTTYLHYKEVALTIVNSVPNISATVEDVNSTTLALTGDSSILIKGYSTASYSITASANKSATISSYSATNSSTSKTTQTGNFTAVKSASFSFGTTDSRGLTASIMATKTLKNYSAPTISDVVTTLTPTSSDSSIGTLVVTVTGTGFNDSFGSVTNILTPTVTCPNVTFIVSSLTWANSTYTFTATSSDTVDLNDSYTIAVKVADSLSSATSSKTAKYLPLFSWNDSRFNFNIEPRYGEDPLVTATELSALSTEYVTETGTSSGWTYRKWSSGKIELWKRSSYSFGTTWTSVGSLYCATQTLSLPFTIPYASRIEQSGTAAKSGAFCFVNSGNASVGTSAIELVAYKLTSTTETISFNMSIHIVGSSYS